MKTPLLAALLFSLLVLPTFADDAITLANGDHFSGTLAAMDDDHIVFDHAYGTLRIPRSEVVLLMVDGSTLLGEQPEPGGAAEGDAGAAEVTEDADDDAASAPAEEEDASEWKGHFEFGGSASFGNSDTQSAHVAVTLVRETLRNVTTIDAGYFYSASNGDRDTNNFTAGIRHDWLMPESPWFFFAQARYDYDEFNSWEHRLGAHGGAGYQLIDEDDFALGLRGGLGATREWKEAATRFEALVGLDLTWQISEKQSFDLSTTLYPEVSNFGEFRWVTAANYSILLDAEAAMSLTAGLRNEYQSDVDPGIKHNDLQIFAGLQFDF